MSLLEKIPRVLLLMILAVRWTSVTCRAQQASTPLNLTLTDAVDLALKQNLDIQIANINSAIRQQDVATTRSELLPHVELDADDSVNRYNLKALIGVQISDLPHSIGPYQAVHVGPKFDMPIFDLTLIRQYQAAGHRFAASRENEKVVREETVLLTVAEYMAHLRSLASISAAQSRVELATQLAHQADDLLTDGVASKIDVSRAQVRLREEQQRLIDAQRESETTIQGLRRLLHLDGAQSIFFADTQNFFATPSLDVPNPLSDAFQQRPELRVAEEQIKAANLDHKAAVSRTLPKLALDGRWNEQGANYAQMTPGYEYRLDFRVPLFTGGRITAERKSTALQEARARKELLQQKDRITEEVRDGQIEIDAAFHQVALGNEQVRLADEEVSLSRGRFQAGVADNIEVVSAQDTLARANDQEIGALFRYNLARARLAHAVGAIEQIYSHP
jgi:outer membrane protein TolC